MKQGSELLLTGEWPEKSEGDLLNGQKRNIKNMQFGHG